jgi:hypothetical protein
MKQLLFAFVGSSLIAPISSINGRIKGQTLEDNAGPP